MKRIAIVEDEVALAENLRDALQRQSYRVELHHSAPQARLAFASELPDLAIIDIGLGEEFEGGFDLCRELRARSATLPIMFLSARDSDFDIVSGLRLGADDYLTKDISQPHLMARIVALLRRVAALQSQEGAAEQQVKVDLLCLNVDRMSAHWGAAEVPLTVTELWMVHALTQHPGHVKSRQQLMDAANIVVDEHTVTSHIKRIRRKFQELDQRFDAIQTAYGMGYRWVSAD